MATCTMTKPKSGTWAETFPKQQMSEQESLKFVKKLLAVAVSNITYLRVILPERAFVDRSVEGVNLKILKCEKSCPGVPLLVDWLKGAFDALEKKYLRVLILGIYTNRDDPDTLIEAYTFKFSYADTTAMDIYKNNKKISSTDASNKTKQATVALLRTLIVLMGTLKPLPDNYMVTMKLFYYDKVTPMDYEPPGFKAAESESFAFEDKPMKIRAGDVSTLFHALKVRVTTVSANFKADIPTEDVEDESPGQQMAMEGLDIEDDEDQEKQEHPTPEKLPQTVQETNNQQASQEDIQQQPGKNDKSHSPPDVEMNAEASSSDAESQDDHNVSQKSTASRRSQGSLVAAAPPVASTPEQKLSDLPKLNGETSGKRGADENRDDSELGVRCCCGNDEDDGLMILCAVCGHWQHGICFMIQNIKEAPSQHICNLCCNPSKPSLQPTDPTLVGLSGQELQMTCLWRRALMACTEEKSVTVNGLSNRLGVGRALVSKVMQRLEREEYIRPAKGKLSKQAKSVNTDKIKKEGIDKYFKKNPCLKQSSVKDVAVESTRQEPDEGLSKSVKSSQAKDIQTIVAGTLNLDLATGSASKSGKVMNSNKTSVPVRASPRLKLKTILQENVSKPGKRLRSTAKDVYDFEFSNTQEDYETSSQPTKRRKASTSARDLEP